VQHTILDNPDTVWDGWNNISYLNSLSETNLYPGTPVTAVSPSLARVDLFSVADDNHVYRASTFYPNATSKYAWTQIGDVSAAPGCYVSAVSSGNYNDLIFVAGSDGQVWTMTVHNIAYPPVPFGVSGLSPLPGIRVG
jgi:hypothetical protein